MPKDPVVNDRWIYQKAVFDEYKKFRDPFVQLDLLTPFKLTKFGIIELSEELHSVQVRVNYGKWNGAPIRDFSEKEVFTLNEGDYGQIRYNWRTSYEDGWCYEKTTINLVNTKSFESKIFLTKKIKKSFEDMPNLW